MASQGALSPATAVDDATVGTLSWTNPGNVFASDNVYAQRASIGGTTHYLKATNFGFTIPAGSTINGILVEIEKKRSNVGADTAVDNKVNIIKSSISATNYASASNWPIVDTYISYGSSTDLWGETWTATDINSSSFGVALSANMFPETSMTIYVDHIRITVYYTETSGATNMQINIGDSWKTISGSQINIGGVWKTVSKVQINIGDTWENVF